MEVSTNVRSSELNYVRYRSNRYDRDIIRAVPHHQKIHELIDRFVRRHFLLNQPYTVLDLGVGTGLTSARVQRTIPKSTFDVIDFSRHMLVLARKRLGQTRVRYLLGDYSVFRFTRTYDLVVSVIGLHHQSHVGKQRIFTKIFRLLKPGGYFIFGDLVTYRNPRQAAVNHARHYHHLVEQIKSLDFLGDWAYHHMYLNNLAPIEDQILWLKEAGFEVEQLFLKTNTSLLIARKPRSKS